MCIYIKNIKAYPISYIQHGNIPIRDSPHSTPLHAVPGGPTWRPRHGIWWGDVNPLSIDLHMDVSPLQAAPPTSPGPSSGARAPRQR